MISWIYGKITDFRNALYEKDVLKSFSLGAKIVSVGNITVGGTGKTPLVAFIAEILTERGEKVCILTRGYGRAEPKKRILVSDGKTVLTDAKNGGDEPLEMANKLLGKAIIIADADRVSAAKWAREKFSATAFVLDDAFQHRRARRDLDVVIVDATNPFGNRKVLPSGILRERLESLNRADLIVISRANLVDDTENLKTEIRKYNSHCSIFVSENVISKITKLQNFTARAQKNVFENRLKTGESEKKIDRRDTENQNPNPETKRALAFCALGNPENFFGQLRRAGFDLAKTLAFPDHHLYALKDTAEIEREAKASGAEILLTTMKDAVKLANFDFDLPCFVVETELHFDKEKSFRRIIESV